MANQQSPHGLNELALFAGGGGGILGGKFIGWKTVCAVERDHYAAGVLIARQNDVCEVEPRHVYVENSPMLTQRGLGTVIGDLAQMGFDAEWGVLSAAGVGAPHIRERIWICATHPSRQ